MAALLTNFTQNAKHKKNTNTKKAHKNKQQIKQQTTNQKNKQQIRKQEKNYWRSEPAAGLEPATNSLKGYHSTN